MLNSLLGPIKLRIMLITAAFMAAYPILFGAVKTQTFDPRLMYTYGGTEGPFSVKPDGTTAGYISTIRPGQSIAWVTTICLEQGVSALGVTELTRLVDGRVISLSEVTIKSDDKRCGERVITRAIPADATPGAYELRRHLILHGPSGPAVTETLPPIGIEVVA
jgi:hypothetical protein